MKVSRIWSSVMAIVVAATTISASQTSQTANPDTPSTNAQSSELKPAATAPDTATAAKPSLASAPSIQDDAVSFAITEIVKMSQSGVGDPVILAYIQTSEIITPPTGVEVIYLKQKGFSSEITTALIRRGAELQAKRSATSTPEVRATQTPSASIQVVPQVVQAQAPVVTYPTVTYYSAPTVVPTTYYYEPPIYYSSYPRYSYSSWYWNSPFISYSGYYPIGYNRGYSHSYGRINSFRSSPPMHSAGPGRNFSTGPGRGFSASPPRGISGPGRNFSTGPGRGFSASPGRGSTGPGRRGR